MTSYRYLGYGTTDDNGVAHYTYTGTGAGEVDVIASLDNPISQGSIVSETYSVIDAKHKYSGTSWKSNLSETANSDGSYTWSSDDGTNHATFGLSSSQYSSGSIYADIGEHYAFDIISTTGTITVRSNTSSSGNKTILTNESSEWTNGTHIVIEIIEDGVKVNGRTISLTGGSGARTFQIRLETNATLTVKNLVHY